MFYNERKYVNRREHMISNQILQNTIDGLKTITRIDMCVLDVDGKVLATTSPDASGYEESVSTFAKSPADSQVISGHQFFKVYDDSQLEYILLVMGGSDDVYIIGKLATFQIQNLMVAYKERFDKDNFIKISFLIIFFLWIYITGRKNFILIQRLRE